MRIFLSADVACFMKVLLLSLAALPKASFVTVRPSSGPTALVASILACMLDKIRAMRTMPTAIHNHQSGYVNCGSCLHCHVSLARLQCPGRSSCNACDTLALLANLTMDVGFCLPPTHPQVTSAIIEILLVIGSSCAICMISPTDFDFTVTRSQC